MLPARYISVQNIYRNENGKVDGKALLKLITNQPSLQLIAPQSEMEEKLLCLWRTILPEQEIGVTQDFFELGGDSLLALQLLAKIKTAFSVEISVDNFFNHTTIREAAGLITEANEQKQTFQPIQRAHRASFVKN
jgi:acyl carrier protein